LNKAKQEYIVYRIAQAEETYQAALELAKSNFWNSCVNRLYYSCFYAVTALLVHENIETKTHNGVKTKFFQHFIKTGIIKMEYSQLYSDLFDWRQKGDYNDFFDLSENDILPLLQPAEDFIQKIRSLLTL
jgi:uncharacterized protein (UPF0332 family)